MSTSGLDEQIRAHRAALEATPGDDEAFRALEGIYARADRWEDLVALYEERVQQGGDVAGGAGPLLAKAAELAHRRMRNTARAEALYRQVLHADPRHPGALASMVELSKERGDLAGLTEALERQANRTAAPDEAARLYMQLGRVQEERLLRRDRAALYYARASRLDPASQPAREAALRCQLALRRFAAAKRTLDAARERAADPRALAAEYARLGQALLDEPLDHRVAMDALVEAQALDPELRGVREALARLEAAPRTWREEARALLERAGEAKERRTAAQLCLHAAALHAAYDPDGAAQVVALAERALLLAPAMSSVLDLLERHFGERGDWRTLSQVMGRLAGALRDRGALAGLYHRMARIDLVQHGDVSLALQSLERALALDPAAEPAAQQAFELHLEAGRRTEALSVLERHLAAAPERPQHGAWRLHAAEIARSLGDGPRARAHLEAARRSDPASPRIAAALAPLLEGAGEWRALAEALATQVQAEPEPARRGRLLEELARVHLDHLEAPRDALRCLAQALRLDPGRPSLRGAIDAVAARADLFPELARAYRAAADVPSADPRARKILLRRTAEVYDRDLGQPERAVEAWRDLIALDPGDAGAKAALEACLLRGGQLGEVAQDLRRRAAAARDAEEHCALLGKLARCHEEAGDPAGAAGAWRELVDAHPGAGARYDEALRGLAKALEALGPEKAEERLEVLGRLAARLSGPAERAEVELARAALLEAPLGRLAEAAAALRAVLAGGGLSAEGHAEAVAGLERLLGRGVEPVAVARALLPVYEARGEPAKQVATLELLAQRLADDPGGEARARALLEAAALREKRLSDSRGALSSAESALRLCPGLIEAIEACERLARGVGALQELYTLLDEVAGRVQDRPAAERPLRLRAAYLAEQDLGDPDGAAAQLRRCQVLDPGDPEALAALTRVALGAERWSEAADLLRDRAERAAGPARAALLAQLAETQQERLNQPAVAAATYRRALEAAAPEARHRLLRRLGGALEAAGEHAELARVLEQLSQVAPDPAEAAEAARTRARLQLDRLGDPMGALAHYRAALTARPADAEARAAIEELAGGPDPAGAAACAALVEVAESSGDPRQIIAALERLAARAQGAAAADAERRAARVWGERLGQWSMAFAALRRAVRAVPGDAEIRGALAEAAVRMGDAAEAVRAYESILPALAGEAAARATAELARLHEERLRDPERAARAWEEVLHLAPGDREALAALARHHRDAGRDRERVEVCLALAEAEGPAEERAAAAREAGQLLEERLGDPTGAAAAWERAAALAPGDEPDATLERLYVQLDRPAELAAALERRRARRPGDLELAFRLAELWRTRLGRPDDALPLLGAVLGSDPDHPGARAALLELAAGPGPLGAAALAQGDALLAARDDHPARVLLRERRLAAVVDPAERAALHAEIRDLLEHVLRRPELAFASAARAFGEGGAVAAEAEPELVRLAESAALHERLAETFEAAAAPGGEGAQDLRRRAARLRSDHGDPGAAVVAWGRVLEAAPDDPEALEALARLHTASGEPGPLAEIAYRRAALADAKGRVAILVELAEQEDRLGDAPRAAAAAEEALRLDPACGPALELLARTFRTEGRTADLARILRAQADAAGEDAARRLDLLLERARLLEDEPDGRAALDAYADVLVESRVEPRALEGLARLHARPEAREGAGRALEEAYRAQGDSRRLADLLEARLETADAAERTPVLAEIAALRERLGDRAAAFAARVRALSELPAGDDAPALRADLERLADSAGAHAPLAEAYEAAIARGLPPAARREVLARLAGLYADRLERPDLAARALEALAAEAPDPAALSALARLYRAQRLHRELADVLRRQAELAGAQDVKKELWLEVATVMQEQLGDREGAAAAYRQILAIDPEDPNALRLLGQVLGAAERWDELVDVLAREAEQAERRPNLAAEAAELRYRLGRIRQQRLADAAGALESYRAVLERVPRHPAALAALEEMAKGGGPAAALAAETLEPIYARQGEHAKLIEALEARARAEADPAARAPLLRRMAEVQASALRNPEAAFLTAARAVREDPDQAESIALAARVAEGAGLEEELASLLAEVADRPRAPGARVELRRRVAGLTGRGEDPRRAADAWARVLELAPDDREALEGLAAALRRAGDGEALAQVLRRRAAIEDEVAPRAALLSELAQLQEEHQGDLPGAIATLRRLLEIEPGRREALARLGALCARTERWAELGEVLAREVALADAAGDAEAAGAARQRLAELKETRLLDRDGAVTLYEEILAARPDDPPALGRLEALLARHPGDGRAAAVLQRAYAATGAWGPYAAVLETHAGERPEPQERKALFRELAEVRERRLGSPDLAFVALCRAFREDPADAALRGELQRLAVLSGHGEELAALYEEEFERLDSAAAADVALTLGEIHEQVLQSPPTAIAWLERARRLDPAAAPRALVALDRLYGAGQQLAGLADVLQEEAELAEGEERTAFLLRLGQLAEEGLRDPARALRAWQDLRAHDPRHPVALRALERHHEAAGRLPELADVLAAQREIATEPAARLRLAARLAATSQELGRDEAAVELWREVAAADPRHEVALSALEALLERLARWPELAELLRARLAVTADRREAARLQDKLGAVLAGRMGDAAQAVRAYQGVLDADPRNKKALEALRDIHAAQGDLEGLASVFRRLVPLQEDAAGVKAVRLQLADVLLRAGKRGEAAEQGRRALELEPHDEADLARLASLFEGAGAGLERVKAVEARAALLADAGRTGEAVEALTASAEAWERQLLKPDAAAAALERVLELEPGRREAFTRLKELHARSGDWRAYVRVCDRFTGEITDRAERLALLKELGEIHEKRLGQKEMAFVTYCRAFGEDPTDAAATAVIERLAAETEAWDELAEVYEQVAEEAKGLGKARLLLQLGRLRDARLDDAEGAEQAFRRALEVDPASPEALDALTELFTRRGRVHDLVIALEQKLEAAAGLDEKKATLLEMARIYDGQLKDPGEAISALRRVLELDGADQAALAALAGLYRREARWPDLAGILARARDLAGDDATRIAYQLQVASLHENELGDDEAAVEDYRAVLGLDDRQREALQGLERLYTKLDRFAELNRVYEREAELAADPRERVRILGKSASIWEEKLGDSRQAIARYEAVLALDGGNLPALKGLESLYRREGLWEKLIAVLQHHVTLTQDRREQVSLEVQIGEVLERELSRPDRAEAMFGHALQIDPESREAVSALARLYEHSGNWSLAIEMLQRATRLGSVGADVVELQARIGRIQEEMLDDRGAAKVAYGRALDADPGHLPSLRALRAIAGAERNRDAYLRYLLSEARYTEADEDKARLLHEAGRIHQEERDDADGATRLYEEALRKVPDFLPAARPLADLYVARADWPRAEAVLDVVVRRLAQEGDPKELCRQSYRLGYVAEKRGERDKALACYRRAYELDATYLPAMEGLGHLLVQVSAWEEGLKVFQAILIHHRDGLTDLEVVETYWQIGELQAKLGQGDRAAKSFEKALEIDAAHVPSRRSLVGVLEAAGDWENAVEHRQKLLGAVDPAGRIENYMAIGAICRDKLQDPYQAIDAFIGAARLEPGHAQATEALLALYRETRQAQKAADVLGRLIASPEAKKDGARTARLRHALALLLRDELRDEAGAARELEAALDADPRFLQAFADLEALLTQGQRWSELEKAYVRMIQRLPKTAEAAAPRLALWRTLGELYHRVLKDPENARMAFEVVARAVPNDVDAVARHAEIAGRMHGHEAEAVGAYRRLVQLGAPPAKAVSALVGLHAEVKAFDQAYTAAQVLAFLLGAATPEEQQVVSRLRRFSREAAGGALDEQLWTQLLPARLRGPMASILALLAREASDVFAQPPKDLGLNPKKDELDVAGSMLFFANMLKYVARALGLPLPRVFRPGEAGARLQVLPVVPPALVVGEDLFRERPKKELWFLLGKAMVFLRPELLLARLMPHDQLDVVFQAAAHLGTSRFTVTADMHLVEKLTRRLEKSLPETTRTQALKILARAYCDEQKPGDLRAYLDAAELASNRAGALLAGDLDLVRRLVTSEKAAASKLKDETRLRDLVTFCVSEEYAGLRERLGLSVVVPAS